NSGYGRAASAHLGSMPAATRISGASPMTASTIWPIRPSAPDKITLSIMRPPLQKAEVGQGALELAQRLFFHRRQRQAQQAALSADEVQRRLDRDGVDLAEQRVDQRVHFQ